MSAVLYTTHLEGTKMKCDIPSTMNNVINDQFALNLVDICLDNTLQILCKLLLCFVKI